MSKKPQRVWTPFERKGFAPVNYSKDLKSLMSDGSDWAIYKNNLYTVQTATKPSGIASDKYPDGMPLLHLSIRRNDRKPIRNWRDLQRIKSEIAGADVDAIELFPAEDRVMDAANQYHLYCLPPGERHPFGEWRRAVATQDETTRAFVEEGLMTEEEAAKFKARQEPFEWDKDISVNEPGMVPGFSDLERQEK